MTIIDFDRMCLPLTLTSLLSVELFGDVDEVSPNISRLIKPFSGSFLPDEGPFIVEDEMPRDISNC